MKAWFRTSIAGLLLCPLVSFGQAGAGDPIQRIKARRDLDSLSTTRTRNAKGTIRMTTDLLAVFRVAGDRCAMAEANGLRSASFADLGELDSTLACAQRIFRLFGDDCDSLVLMRGYVALSRFHRAVGEWGAVDSLSQAGLALWNPRWGSPFLRNALLTNRAIAAANRGDLSGSMTIFKDVLDHALLDDDAVDMDDALSNLGVLHGMSGDLDSSDHFFRRALANARSNGNLTRTGALFQNLAFNAEQRGAHGRSVVLLDSAMKYAVLASDLALQIKVEKGLTLNYYSLGDVRSAYLHSRAQFHLQDSLLNTEKVKALAEMQEKYESEKKAKEILGLKADNLQGELERVRVKRTRNIYLFTGLVVLVGAIGLFGRLRVVHRSRKAIRQEKEISEGLLHNILPEEVAAEIKTKGFADVREFTQATVLFTDFKGFTALSEQLTAAQLVAEIDHCFKAFDGVMERHGIEKIKTIGDAYMAAGGLPDTSKGAPTEVVLAALEMQHFMASYKEERMAQGRPFFEMRLGVHTGPVIAGIVGVKKYAYDIWGDTVNTASRMESSGEVGQVNISAVTHELLKDEPMFTFVSRGLVQAKGKGEMAMFFVHSAA